MDLQPLRAAKEITYQCQCRRVDFGNAGVEETAGCQFSCRRSNSHDNVVLALSREQQPTVFVRNEVALALHRGDEVAQQLRKHSLKEEV